ncbi:MAG: TetR family transcriptional regulator [Phenylobacterium zucineum]|nr:MAG: TetR family transcriptional regulator [Phenylobacterium zucineum]
MPTPAHTSIAEIVAAGRAILATEGLDGLTMNRVAEATGVRAPSLYKHVSNRAQLVRLVATAVIAEVGSELDRAATTGDPAGDLRALASAMREFAQRDPHGFGLLFQPLPAESSLDPAVYAAAAAPVLRVTGELAGPDRALVAARTVTAWASGFLRMELAGGFQLGERVADAFDYGIALLADAIGAHSDRTEHTTPTR